MKRHVQVLLIIGILLMAGCAPLQTCTMEPAIEHTRTGSDQEALVSRYEQEARMAQEKAEQYRKTVERYTRHRNKVNATLASDADRLARECEKAAEENRALAKSHRGGGG